MSTSDTPFSRDRAVELAQSLYTALAQGDRKGLASVLHAEFMGQTTAGLPYGLGGSYESASSMQREFWGRIAENFVAEAQPSEFNMLDDGRLLVLGRYVGTANGGGALDADFAHVLSFRDDRISGLVQLTDSERWHRAAQEATATQNRAVELSIDDGVGVLRLNRPEARNAIDETVANELYEAVQQCASDVTLRALVLAGNGPSFTVGGDISLFADAAPDELPALLRRMTTPYHDVIRMLCELQAPVVAAVHGSVAGGGLGLLYCADVALAAENTKFATGFAALGLSGDGGSSWFLPRLVGPRRAAELYFERRVLDAHEAQQWGLVTRVVTAEQLQEQAMSLAGDLARGPTRAYGEIRTLLRDSWTSTLAEQLAAEIGALGRTGTTADAPAAIQGFVHKSSVDFQGR